MDFRRTKSVAGLALLMGGAGCAFLTPAACAGDRIEFSAPAIPLAVPQPAVEVKEPDKTMSSPGVAPEPMGDPGMTSSTEIVIRRQKRRDPWDADPLRDGSSDQRHRDDWFPLRPDSSPNRMTNGSNLNMEHIWDENDSASVLRRKEDSKNGADQKDPKSESRRGFGAPEESEKEKGMGRDGDRFELGFSTDKDDPIWSKIFNHDPAGMDQSDAGWSASFQDGFRAYTGGAYTDRMKNTPSPDVSANGMEWPSEFGNASPLDSSRGEQTDMQAGAALGYQQDPLLSAGQSPFANAPKPDESRSSHALVPDRSATLQMPKRPGDPY